MLKTARVTWDWMKPTQDDSKNYLYFSSPGFCSKSSLRMTAFLEQRNGCEGCDIRAKTVMISTSECGSNKLVIHMIEDNKAPHCNDIVLQNVNELHFSHREGQRYITTVVEYLYAMMHLLNK